MDSVNRSSLFCDTIQLSVNDRVPIGNSELWTEMTRVAKGYCYLIGGTGMHLALTVHRLMDEQWTS